MDVGSGADVGRLGVVQRADHVLVLDALEGGLVQVGRVRDGLIEQRLVVAVSDRPSEEQIVLLKSWNEWAEGNYLEPDQLNGRRLLEATLEVVNMVSGEVKDA